MSFKIKKSILIVLSLAMVVLLAVFFLSTRWMQFNQEALAMEQAKVSARALFDELIQQEASQMSDLLDRLAAQEALKIHFRDRDRKGLLAAAQPFFHHVQKDHDITHFYFITPEGTAFLRPYDPGRHGDTLHHLTLSASMVSGQTTWGVELGGLGTFTLRVVMPWREKGKVIGYVALGKEIHTLLARMHRVEGAHFFLLLAKSQLEREKWEAGMALLGLPAHWEQFSDEVLTSATAWRLPRGFASYILLASLDPARMGGQSEAELLQEHNHFFSILLKNVGQQPVGRIVGVYDDAISEQIARDHLLVVFFSTLSVAGLVWILFGRFLNRMEARLLASDLDLKKSEARLRGILDTALDAIITVDGEGRILEFNAAAERIFKLPREKALGRNVATTIVPPEMREKHLAGFRRHLETGRSTILNKRLELPAITADGVQIESELAITPIPSQGDTPVFTAFLRDITNRKQMMRSMEEAFTSLERSNRRLGEEMTERRLAQEALVSSERRYRSIIASTAEGFWLFTTDPLKILEVNDSLCQMLGVPREEILGKTPLDFVHPQHREALVEISAQVSQNEHRTFETTFVAADGHLLHLHGHCSALFDSTRQVTSAFTFFNDLTERIQAEQVIRESEDRFRSVTQSISDAIVAADEMGRITFWNQGAEKIFGYAAAEVMGESLDLLIPAQYGDAHRVGFERINKTGEHTIIGKTIEVTSHRKGGEIFPVEMSLNTWQSHKGRFFPPFSGISPNANNSRSSFNIWPTTAPSRVCPTGACFWIAWSGSWCDPSAIARDWRCFSWISTDSRPSTIPWGTNPAIICSWKRPSGLHSHCARLIPSPDLAAMNFAYFTEVHQPEDAKLVAGKILESFRRPFKLKGGDHFVGTSIGIALYPGAAEDPEGLIRIADQAMVPGQEQRQECFSI